MTIQHGLMQDCLAKLQDGAGPAPRDLGPVHEHTAYPMYVPLFVHFFTLHKTLHHAAMLWIEHLIKKHPLLNSWTAFLFKIFFSIHQHRFCASKMILSRA